jgi:putative oxidoreductase
MAQDMALLVLRVVIGALLFGHGAQKFFGWFGGPGFAKTRTMMGVHLRLRPATFWSVMAVLSETGGGLLFAAGFLQPLGALGIAAAMLMAINAHWPKVWASERGFEYPLTLLAGALTIGLMGGGRYTLDRALGIAVPSPVTFLVGLAVVLVSVTIALLTRAPRPTPAPQPEAATEAVTEAVPG